MPHRQVRTTRFGELEVDETDVITFDEGLVGFEDFTSAMLVAVDADGLFWWLQSVDQPDAAFLLLTPWPLFPAYEPELPTLDQGLLALDDPADALVFCVVTSHQEPRRLTANLAGPVIVNHRTQRGRQVVLETEHPMRAELPAPPG